MRNFPLMLCVLWSAPAFSVSEDDLAAHNVTIQDARYEDRVSVRVVESTRSGAEDKIAILVDSELQNGTISGYVSGGLLQGAGAQARGFVGLAFRIDDEVSSFEAVYLRPTNARAEDQLRRNHSIQYFSFPDFPWHRLRKESPAKYESYADMVPGEWVHYRLDVEGNTARLFLNKSEQPVLVVNDLKLGNRSGRVGLWVGPGTEAHFSDIDVEVR